MRITYIHQHFSLPNEFGGQRPWEFTRRLARDGHDVTVLCGGPNSLETTVENVKVVRIEAPYDNAMSTGQRIKSFALFMARAALKAMTVRSDLVFASSTPLTTAVPGILGSVAQRVPMVFEVRDLWPSVPAELGVIRSKPFLLAARIFESVAYRASEHVIALSPGMAKGVRRVSPTTPVSVVPNASDIELFARARANRVQVRDEMGWAPDETVLFYAGSFGHSYDVNWLVELAARLDKQSNKYRVVIYGKGATNNDLILRATELGLSAQQLIPGSIPKVDVAKMLPAADFAVSTLIDTPALEVNSLNKVFDALAASTPVLFNHGGWLPELLEHENAGFRLSRDPDIAAQQLNDFLKDPYAREKLARNALTLGKTHFSRDILYSKFKEVLELAASNGRSAVERLLDVVGHEVVGCGGSVR